MKVTLCCAGIALLISLGLPRTTSATGHRVTPIAAGGNFEQYLIEVPDVDITANGDGTTEPYPEIPVRPGDLVALINVGGCVKNESGWWPYLEGSDPNRNVFVGTVSITGAGEFVPSPGYKPIRDVIGQWIAIDKNLRGPASFQLGYAWWGPNTAPSYIDDGSLKNTQVCSPNRWTHLDSVTHQPLAFLYVNIVHGKADADYSQLRPWDIVPINGTWGGWLVNPVWAYQVQQCGTLGPWNSLNCLTTFAPFCGDKGNPANYTDQDVNFDGLTSYCSRIDYPSYPALFNGWLRWEDQAHYLDHDSTWDISTLWNGITMGGELLPVVPHNGFQELHVEHDTRETLDPITGTAYGSANQWWRGFKAAEDSSNADGQAFLTSQTKGKLPRGVILAVPGLDCAHDAHTVELHPAYAVAIRVRDAYFGLQLSDDPNQGTPETWEYFIRNFGNNGGCGSTTFQLWTPGYQVAILLPQPAAPDGYLISGATLSGSFMEWWQDCGNKNMNGVAMYVPGQGISLTAFLEDPRCGSGIAGELSVKWQFTLSPPPNTKPPISTSMAPCVTIYGGRFCAPPPKTSQIPLHTPLDLGNGPEEMFSFWLKNLPQKQRQSVEHILLGIEREADAAVVSSYSFSRRAQVQTAFGGEMRGPAQLPVHALPAMNFATLASFSHTRVVPDPLRVARTNWETSAICKRLARFEGFPSGFCRPSPSGNHLEKQATSH